MIIRRHFACCRVTVAVEVPEALQNCLWFVNEQSRILDAVQSRHNCVQALDRLEDLNHPDDPATRAGDTRKVSPSAA